MNLSFLVSGDFLIRNETIESKIVLYQWPRVHQLEYKIQNHDDLLSYAQIDIVDTDVGRSRWKFLPFYWFYHFIKFRNRTRCTSTLNRTFTKSSSSASKSSVGGWKSTTKLLKIFIISRGCFHHCFRKPPMMIIKLPTLLG